MSKPRPERRKYGLSLGEIAERLGESLSSVKRQSAENDPLLVAKVQALLNDQSVKNTSLPDGLELNTAKMGELFAEYQAAERDLVAVYFELVKLAWNDDSLRARLKPVFGIAGKHIEEQHD